MSVNIEMPKLSDTMTEGTLIKWHKQVGDSVEIGDVLADVETDKATMEVVGYEEGTLLYIGVEAGNAAKINEIIAIIGKAGTDVSAYVAAEKSGANAGATGCHRTHRGILIAGYCVDTQPQVRRWATTTVYNVPQWTG